MSRENMKKGTDKEFISIAAVVVLPLILLLLIFTFPMPAAQEEGMSPEILRTLINGWNGGGTGGLSATVSGDIVTVTGNVTGATNTLRLNIPAGVTIVWQANLTGSLTGDNRIPGLINIHGDGTFEVASGKIENTARFWRSATILSGALNSNGRLVIDNGEVIVSRIIKILPHYRIVSQITNNNVSI